MDVEDCYERTATVKMFNFKSTRFVNESYLREKGILFKDLNYKTLNGHLSFALWDFAHNLPQDDEYKMVERWQNLN